MSIQQQFDSAFFDTCKKEWRKNKVKYPNGRIILQKTGLIYYKTNSDSPLELSEFRCKTAKHPNNTKWSECGYVDSSGKICQEQGIFNEDDIHNPEQNSEYDHEKYLTVKFCDEHQKYERKEKQKREKHLEELLQNRV